VPVSTLVLWDIDNTLLYTGGAGSIGMTLAFRDLYGVDDAFGKVEFSGRTDMAIFRDCARMHGVAEATLEAEQARFLEAYLPHLAAALIETRGTLMPGVAAVLDALSARNDVLQALGTGNFRRAGDLKLRHYGIAQHFPDMPDTPHDIAAARTNGAFALGVATGRDSVDDLLACGADVALSDLGDVDRVLGVVLDAAP
jgi:phosphoglycolate phosphatase-like HAD superfamily hydrolase